MFLSAASLRATLTQKKCPFYVPSRGDAITSRNYKIAQTILRKLTVNPDLLEQARESILAGICAPITGGLTELFGMKYPLPIGRRVDVLEGIEKIFRRLFMENLSLDIVSRYILQGVPYLHHAVHNSCCNAAPSRDEEQEREAMRKIPLSIFRLLIAFPKIRAQIGERVHGKDVFEHAREEQRHLPTFVDIEQLLRDTGWNDVL